MYGVLVNDVIVGGGLLYLLARNLWVISRLTVTRVFLTYAHRRTRLVRWNLLLYTVRTHMIGISRHLARYFWCRRIDHHMATCLTGQDVGGIQCLKYVDSGDRSERSLLQRGVFENFIIVLH